MINRQREKGEGEEKAEAGNRRLETGKENEEQGKGRQRTRGRNAVCGLPAGIESSHV